MTRWAVRQRLRSVQNRARQIHLDAGRGWWLALAALAILVPALVETFSVSTVPVSLLVLPFVLGVLVLRMRQLRVLVLVDGVCAVIAVNIGGWSGSRIGFLAVLAVVALISLYTVSVRERLGIVGTRGDAMLSELRDRLVTTSGLTDVPAGWQLEVAARAAGGTAFGGDFAVSNRLANRWEFALVDVSGKGIDAGTRALQLSGALGGLLGALPPGAFLAEANRYLLRQDWDEGFATAVHVTLDITTGGYEVRSAGHPPVGVFSAGNGDWTLSPAEGPALGLLPGATYAPACGHLHRRDALLLYTDGLVEIPGRDLAVGIDKLLGEANRLVVHGFTGGSERLLRRVAPAATDDRAAVLLWRE